MKIKVSEATRVQLNWLVAKLEGQDVRIVQFEFDGKVQNVVEILSEVLRIPVGYADYASSWDKTGPIIEREKIAIDWDHDRWNASTHAHPAYYSASTPLVAACRCFCASKLGFEVEIPEELL